jgi:hypothetical protein
MDPSVDETVKLQALLQELIKVKKLLGSREIKIEE